MSDPTRRRFDDEEVSLIIKRATELQATQSGDVEAPGMSLADLEAIAREAGLDPALVRRAAAEVTERHPSQVTLRGGNAFLGAPTSLRFEHVVDRELTAEDHEMLVDEIRRTMHDVGTLSTVGRTLAWSSTPTVSRRGRRGRSVQVTIASRDGRSAIRVEETTTALAGAMFGGIMGGAGGGSGGIVVGLGMQFLHSLPAALAAWVAVIGGTYGLARTLFTGAMRRRAAQLSSLADRLAEMTGGR